MAYDGMHDAMTKEANKQTRVLRRLAMTGALIMAAGLGAGATFLGYGVDANLPWPVTANTTIAAKHCGGTVLAGTGSTGQFTLTLPAVTGFPSDCSVLIKNGDSTNGKILSGFPSDFFPILYPQQSAGVKIVNGAWQSFYNPGPWNVPPGGVALYANPTGSDSNDCLTTGTACTLAGACVSRRQINTGRSGGFTINLSSGTFSTVDSNNELCGIYGNAGGSAPALTSLIGQSTSGSPGNTVLAIPNNGLGVVVKDGGEVVIQGVEFTAGNNAIGIQAAGQSAVADIGPVFWGTWGTGGVHVSGTSGAYVSLVGSGEWLLANFTYHWDFSGDAQFTAGAPTTIPSAVSWSGAFLSASGNPYINLSGWSTTGAGVAGSTGAKATLNGPGYLITPSNAPCNSAFPGNQNCQLSAGFQDGAGDPTKPPVTIYANLPGTIAGYFVVITDGLAANCGDGLCTTLGTTVTGGGGGLNLLLWADGTNWRLVGQTGTATLPKPTASTLGGIESITSLAHFWIAYIDTSGIPHQAQPACGDLSNAGAACQLNLGAGLASSGGNAVVSLSSFTNSLSSNVNLSSTAWTDGPTVAQGTSGTWMAVGQVTIQSSVQDVVSCKLWDGTNLIAGIDGQVVSAGGYVPMPLSGKITSPAGNIRISCINDAATRGSMRSADAPGNESTLTVFRIGN